ncbi:MAG: SufS family cysteine desulfurase [Candidatus Nanopelagicales bacterium]
MIDVAAVKQDFPILKRRVRANRELIYLDSAATSQKPTSVIEAVSRFYEQSNAAIHRGAHALAEAATEEFEAARETIAHFVGAESRQIHFTKNATESINAVAYMFLNESVKFHRGLDVENPRFVLQDGDEIIVTEMEHHANLVPWQELCLKTGAVLKIIPINDEGRLELTNLTLLITEKTKVVSFVHQSNILGTINPIDTIINRARSVGALTVLDACQSAPHLGVNLEQIGIDFAAFSGHKMLGPLGVGILYIKDPDHAPVFLTGGSMIEKVTLQKSTYAKAPQRFEAGTQSAAEVIGLATALDYLKNLGMDNIHQHELALTKMALEGLMAIPQVRIIGPTNIENRGGIISFTLADLHPHDVGQVLDEQGIAVRVGHHCAWPVCTYFNVPATTRASFYLYNDERDVEMLVSGVKRTLEYFGVA